MKRLLLFVAANLFVASVYAQVAADTLQSTDVHESEIWLDVSPVALVLLGGQSYRPEYGLMYKHHLKDKYWLRAGATFTPDNFSFGLGSDYHEILFGDSLTRITSRTKNNFYTGRIGVERRTTKNRWTNFIGGDLIVRYQDYSRQVDESTYKLDSIGPYPDRNRYTSFHQGTHVQQYSETKRSIGAGIGFVVGMSYAVSNRFLISGQTNIDLIYSMSEVQKTVGPAGVKTVDNTNGVDLNMRLLQLNLAYRFW